MDKQDNAGLRKTGDKELRRKSMQYERREMVVIAKTLEEL